MTSKRFLFRNIRLFKPPCIAVLLTMTLITAPHPGRACAQNAIMFESSSSLSQGPLSQGPLSQGPLSQGLIDATAIEEDWLLAPNAVCNSTVYSDYDYSPDVHPSARSPYPRFRTDSNLWQWSALPDGLLWHSYLAGLHEPRISTVILGDNDENGYWDATLGGRIGLLRFGTPHTVGGEGWQWDAEGGVITRLNILKSEDVESMDYRFGTVLTTRQGEWGAKFGYFHISSHVGDEYVVRNPTYERVNYVTESLIAGLSYHPNSLLRLYGEMAVAVKHSGGAKPLQFQTGFEYIAEPLTQASGSPFTAVNIDIRQCVDFNPSITLQTGWQWQGTYSERRFRTGLQYFNGASSQFQFFENNESHLGVGVWYDY